MCCCFDTETALVVFCVLWLWWRLGGGGISLCCFDTETALVFCALRWGPGGGGGSRCVLF